MKWKIIALAVALLFILGSAVLPLFTVETDQYGIVQRPRNFWANLASNDMSFSNAVTAVAPVGGGVSLAAYTQGTNTVWSNGLALFQTKGIYLVSAPWLTNFYDQQSNNVTSNLLTKAATALTPNQNFSAEAFFLTYTSVWIDGSCPVWNYVSDSPVMAFRGLSNAPQFDSSTFIYIYNQSNLPMTVDFTGNYILTTNSIVLTNTTIPAGSDLEILMGTHRLGTLIRTNVTPWLP